MAKARTEIIQGMTVSHYHVLTTDLEQSVIAPEREAVLRLLAGIGPDRFVEFIIDVLVLVEKHKLIDNTDGPGDEKQDILTLDPNGKRHLTQSKHTIDYKSNTSGDELDLMLGACLRKNCRNALYVTNADLTVQAKRYVNDREYARGWSGSAEDLPGIEYWNGTRIWERISRNNAILNKWFSGTAQAHALRRFQIDLAITAMPRGSACAMDAEAFAKKLSSTHKVSQGSDGRSHDIIVDDELTLNVSDRFRTIGEFEANFLPPGDGPLHGNPRVPLKTLRSQLMLSAKVGAFDPATYVDRVVRLFGGALDIRESPEWWHVVVVAPQALVFLQDVGRAVIASIGSPKGFVVSDGGIVSPEYRFAFDPGGAWKRLVDDDDPSEESWLDEHTGTILLVLVEEEVHPLSLLDIHARQAQLIQSLRNSTFRGIEGADPTVVETVRRLSSPEWSVMRDENGLVIIAYPPDADAAAVTRLENALGRRRIKILSVSNEDRERLIAGIDTHPTKIGMLVTSGRASLMPMQLDRRIFWFSRQHPLKGKLAIEKLLELIAYKFTYEAKNGFEEAKGKSHIEIPSEALRQTLADFASIRGTRMLDIVISHDHASVNMRAKANEIIPASDLATRFLNEFEPVWQDVIKLLDASVVARPKATDPPIDVEASPSNEVPE